MHPLFFPIFVKRIKMINSVRNTVLSVLNKNNYGYISPADFNLYAKQAQMELFEEYFSQYNKTIGMENSRLSGTGYADISKKVAENLETFLTSAFLLKIVGYSYNSNFNENSFLTPSFNYTGDTAYMINNVVVYPTVVNIGVNTNIDAFNVDKLIDTTVDFIALGVKTGDAVSNFNTNQVGFVLSVLSSTSILVYPPMFAFIGESYGIFSIDSAAEAEKVLSDKIFALTRSNLTAPSAMFPAYVYNNFNTIGNSSLPSILSVYPKTINYFGQVQATYFRFPKDPKWTYITLVNGEPSFDQSQLDYQDFELQGEDEYKLAMKILQYCGISIREQEVAQFAMAQEQHEQPTFIQQ
jgi:hypothetical protein